MAMRRIEFTGPVKWAQVWDGQIDREYEDTTNPKNKGGNWKIVMVLDDVQLKTYRALDLAMVKVKGDDGNEVTFRRYEFAYNKDGDRKNLGAPKVILPEGLEEGTAIGNGSNCACIVDVYETTTPKGKTIRAARLNQVTVLEHVPYEGGGIEVESASGPAVPF